MYTSILARAPHVVYLDTHMLYQASPRGGEGPGDKVNLELAHLLLMFH